MDTALCHDTPGCILHRFPNGPIGVIGDLSVSLYDLLGCVQSDDCTYSVTPILAGWSCQDKSATYERLLNQDGAAMVDYAGSAYLIEVPTGIKFDNTKGRFICDSDNGYTFKNLRLSGIDGATFGGGYRYAGFGKTGSSVDDTYADHEMQICWTAESATATEATTCPVNDDANGVYGYTPVDDFTQKYFTYINDLHCEQSQQKTGNMPDFCWCIYSPKAPCATCGFLIKYYT